jgi:hypothetical protein
MIRVEIRKKKAEKQKFKTKSQTKRFEASSSFLLGLVVNL